VGHRGHHLRRRLGAADLAVGINDRLRAGAPEGTYPLWTWTDRGPGQVRADRLVALVPAEQWLRDQRRTGPQGTRSYYWTRVPLVRYGWPAGEGFCMLVRHSNGCRAGTQGHVHRRTVIGPSTPRPETGHRRRGRGLLGLSPDCSAGSHPAAREPSIESGVDHNLGHHDRIAGQHGYRCGVAADDPSETTTGQLYGSGWRIFLGLVTYIASSGRRRYPGTLGVQMIPIQFTHSRQIQRWSGSGLGRPGLASRISGRPLIGSRRPTA
jgi:hypothetical protein